MKRFLIIAIIFASFCGVACAQEQAIETVVTQQSVVVPSLNPVVSRTVIRGPFGFVRARASSVSAIQACAPAVEACAPVVTEPACAPVVAAPSCIKTCLTGIKPVRTIIKERPVRVFPRQVIRTKTVVR